MHRDSNLKTAMSQTGIPGDPMSRRIHISPRHQVAKLTKIGIALSSELDLGRLLSMIVTEARRLLNCDAASLYTVENDCLRFRVIQCASLRRRQGAEPLRPMLFKIDKSRIATYVALTGQPLNIPDVYRIPRGAEYRFQQDMDKLMGYRTRSMMTVPIHDREREVIGVLQLINALDGNGREIPGNVVPFTSDCEDLAMALASQAGVAIRNAQLLEDLRALFYGIVQFSAHAIDGRDPSAVGHSRRVSELVLRMARAASRSRAPAFAHVDYSMRRLEALRYAGWLHDVGKIAISEDLLTKGRRLPADRLRVLQTRYAAIRHAMIHAALREQVRLLQDPQASARDVANVERKLETALRRLDRDTAFVTEAAGIRPLNKPRQERLAAIARQTFVTPEGERFEFLTNEELEHLSIPRGTLTASELSEVRSHVAETERFLSKIPFRGWLKDTPRLASLHHEMLDGSGYPNGLRGDQIPLEARMLAIADTFDAMTAADRPYRKAFTIRRALKMLGAEAARGRLDADLVELFRRKHLYQTPSGRKGGKTEPEPA